MYLCLRGPYEENTKILDKDFARYFYAAFNFSQTECKFLIAISLIYILILMLNTLILWPLLSLLTYFFFDGSKIIATFQMDCSGIKKKHILYQNLQNRGQQKFPKCGPQSTCWKSEDSKLCNMLLPPPYFQLIICINSHLQLH